MATLTPTPSLSLYDEFLARTAPDRLQKIFARYELFKMVLDVPGDIVECGVFKGSGLYTWVKLMRLFKPNNEYRVVGFDFFETAREMQLREQLDKDCLVEHSEGWTSRDVLTANCREWGFDRLKLVPGDVVKSTEAYAREHWGSRISLLYLDVDNYEGSLAILKNLYPMVSPGGVVAFDEYAIAGYGESDAVDEFLRGRNIKLRCFPWANTPSAYFVKESA